MKKLNTLYFSHILHKKVYDEFGDCIGKLWDVYVTTEDGYPRAIGYKIKRDGDIFNNEFRFIEFWEDNSKIIIKVKGEKDIIPRAYSYLLSKNLLGKQIVDVNGKKVVRVNDLKIVILAGEIRIIAVDSGVYALGRRFGVERVLTALYKLIGRKPSDYLIMWDDVESLEMVDDSLKISVPYKKLSKLHPADLADILEEMNPAQRMKIFESLDDDLAADTLEEIEPEYQADLLQTLSNSKAAEVLEAMPNDEIADILDEVDEETAEKLLLNLEKDDAEEVRELMAYEEETIGSIMNTDFIAFNINITIEETIELLRESKPDDEVVYYIYIIDEDEKLQGVVSLRDLIISEPEKRLKDIMKESIVTVRLEENIESAIEIATKYDLLSFPVIDNQDKLKGIVIIHDIVDYHFNTSKKRKYKKLG